MIHRAQVHCDSGGWRFVGVVPVHRNNLPAEPRTSGYESALAVGSSFTQGNLPIFRDASLRDAPLGPLPIVGAVYTGDVAMSLASIRDSQNESGIMVVAPNVPVPNSTERHVGLGASDVDRRVGRSTPLSRRKLIDEGAGLKRYVSPAHFIQRGELKCVLVHKCGCLTVVSHFKPEEPVAVLQRRPPTVVSVAFSTSREISAFHFPGVTKLLSASFLRASYNLIGGDPQTDSRASQNNSENHNNNGTIFVNETTLANTPDLRSIPERYSWIRLILIGIIGLCAVGFVALLI